MYLARGLKSLCLPQEGCVATIGNFDGVHLGHQAIIKNLAEKAQQLNLPLVVVLFEPQPREYFDITQSPPRLMRLREKLGQLAKLPVDAVLLLRFDQQLAELSAEDFIETVLIEGLKVRHLVIGDDFRFGQRRKGNFAMLKDYGDKYGFRVEDSLSFLVEGQRVSSTLIREALAFGEMGFVERLLGHPYSMCGRIVQGAQLGRRLGFPTANIAVLRKKTPLQGVFAVTMTGIADHPLLGVANLGIRPSVDAQNALKLETHLFDFSRDIYGLQVEVHFHHKLRDEQRFDDVKALTEQIDKDARHARDFFATKLKN